MRVWHEEQFGPLVPVVPFREGWADTLAWFKAHWLPYFDKRASAGFAGLEKRAEAKIEAQVKGSTVLK